MLLADEEDGVGDIQSTWMYTINPSINPFCPSPSSPPNDVYCGWAQSYVSGCCSSLSASDRARLCTPSSVCLLLQLEIETPPSCGNTKATWFMSTLIGRYSTYIHTRLGPNWTCSGCWSESFWFEELFSLIHLEQFAFEGPKIMILVNHWLL